MSARDFIAQFKEGRSWCEQTQQWRDDVIGTNCASRLLEALESAGYVVVKVGYDTATCEKMLKSAKRAAMTFPQTDGLDFNDMIDSVILAGLRAAIEAVNESLTTQTCKKSLQLQAKEEMSK